MTCHEDSLCLLDDRPSTERTLEIVVLGESLQRDVDRALKLLRARVDDVRKHTALCRLVYVVRVARREQRDHGAESLVDDLRDQLERLRGREPDADQGNVGALLLGHRRDPTYSSCAITSWPSSDTTF